MTYEMILTIIYNFFPDCCVASINADIIEDTYSDIIQNKEFNKLAKCAILFVRNADVD